MGNPVTTQLVRHDFPGLASMTPFSRLKKRLAALPSLRSCRKTSTPSPSWSTVRHRWY